MVHVKRDGVGKDFGAGRERIGAARMEGASLRQIGSPCGGAEALGARRADLRRSTSRSRPKIIELLIELGRSLGLTYVFISHDLSLMRNFVSRVGILYLGRLIEVGSVARLFDAPAHPYTRSLIASVPVISDAEQAMKPKEPILEGEVPVREFCLNSRVSPRSADFLFSGRRTPSALSPRATTRSASSGSGLWSATRATVN